jgi:glycerol-3-phosphate dehydrogenase (NAD(P)+)
MKICVLAPAPGARPGGQRGGPPRGHALGARCRPGRCHIGRAREHPLPAWASLAGLAAVRAGDIGLAAQAGAMTWSIVATPMAALREQLIALRGTTAPVAWLCKGVEPALDTSPTSGLLAHEIWAQVAPDLRAGVLSGPSFAQEVAEGPADSAGSRQPARGRARRAGRCFPRPGAARLCQRRHRGRRSRRRREERAGHRHRPVRRPRARAQCPCRAHHARPGRNDAPRPGARRPRRDLHGPFGPGRSGAYATGDLSRNRKVGLLLAQGRTLAQAVASLGHVAEGVYCARTVVQRARGLGLEMPIAEGVVALLDGRVSPKDAVAALTGRDPVPESVQPGGAAANPRHSP